MYDQELKYYSDLGNTQIQRKCYTVNNLIPLCLSLSLVFGFVFFFKPLINLLNLKDGGLDFFSFLRMNIGKSKHTGKLVGFYICYSTKFMKIYSYIYILMVFKYIKTNSHFI